MAVHLSYSNHLRADGLSVAYPDRRVFADLGFAVAPGDRLGLIGENGVGKSTLLRLIAADHGADASGAEPLDRAEVAGRITRPRRTGLLSQELPFAPDDRVDLVLEAALAPVRAIERELDAAAAALGAGPETGERSERAAEAWADAAAARYAAALDAAERAEVWTAEARRDELLDGLGVAGLGRGRRIDELSGGQRSRFALAALLLSAPDALLLDEPTNHLDDAAAEFLEGRLRAFAGPVVFASHDRAFLDRAATGLLDLDPGRQGALAASAGGASATRGAGPAGTLGGTVFGGGFSEFLEVKAEERARWQRQYDDEQDELRRLRASIGGSARNVSHGRAATDNDKFLKYFKGENVERSIARRVRNAEQRLATLEREQLRRPPAPLEFAGIPSGSHALEESAGLLVQLDDVEVAGRLRIERLHLEPLTRMLVTGANGAGKSTLLGVLAGSIAADRGAVQWRKGLRVQLLEQDVRFADPAATPRATYERVLGERRAEQVPLSGLGLLAPRDLERAIGALSVGQQRRLALALVLARPPHVFLLDEPTNHLSLALATELEEALGGYPGAVVIASHDRWLRRRWAGEQLELESGSAVPAAVAG